MLKDPCRSCGQESLFLVRSYADETHLDAQESLVDAEEITPHIEQTTQLAEEHPLTLY